MRAGAHVVWRCHVGVDTPNAQSEHGWEFLRPYVEGRRRLRVLARTVRAELGATSAPRCHRAVDRSLLGEERSDGSRRGDTAAAGTSGCWPARRRARRGFTRRDGSHGHVTRASTRSVRAPRRRVDVPIVLQSVALGHAEGHERRPHGIRGTHRRSHRRAPDPCRPADERRRRRPRGESGACGTASHSGTSSRASCSSGHISRASRWTTPTRTPRSSTRSNAMRPSSSRRASPKASVSRSWRPCGSRDRSSPARWAGSSTRSFRARPGCCSTIVTDLEQFGAGLSARCWPIRRTGAMGANGRQRTVEQFLGDRHLEQWAEVFAGLDGAT